MLISGWPARLPKPEIGLINFQYQPTDILPTNTQRLAVGYSFSFNASLGHEKLPLRPVQELDDFVIKLPDAYLNGNLISFPEIQFFYREIFYYETLCFR